MADVCLITINDQFLGIVISIVTAIAGFLGAKLHSSVKKP